jgi:hypothetical protein
MACAALADGLLAKRGDKGTLGDSQVRTRPRFSNAGSTHGFALRQIRKQPGFAVIGAIVLALGIGSSAAVFSVLYHSLLRPLPYADPQQLLFVHNFFFSPKNQVSAGGVSAFDYAAIRRHTDVFTSAGIFYWNDLTLTGLDDARHIGIATPSARPRRALIVGWLEMPLRCPPLG